MNKILRLTIDRIRRIVWGLIVAYMLGLHNFYKGEDRTVDDIRITTEQTHTQEDGSLK